MNGVVRITLAEEPIELWPDRFAFRPATGELLISDVHYGKDHAFRRYGRAVPEGASWSELERIDRAVERCGATRVTVLGDLTHGPLHPESTTFERLRDWLATKPEGFLRLVFGNHDRHAAESLAALPIDIVEDPSVRGPIVYHHDPPSLVDQGTWLAGHLHPGIVLERGPDRLRLPVFWRRGDGLVLPAFGRATGLAIVRREPSDRVYIAGDRQVLVGP